MENSLSNCKVLLTDATDSYFLMMHHVNILFLHNNQEIKVKSGQQGYQLCEFSWGKYFFLDLMN